jgi:hypothetical protein
MLGETDRGKIHSELIPELDLVELHRRLAALTNAHSHHDLRGMPEVERQTAIADVRQQIEQRLAFERMPWQAALEEASRKVDGEHTSSPRRSTI